MKFRIGQRATYSYCGEKKYCTIAEKASVKGLWLVDCSSGASFFLNENYLQPVYTDVGKLLKDIL